MITLAAMRPSLLSVTLFLIIKMFGRGLSYFPRVSWGLVFHHSYFNWAYCEEHEHSLWAFIADICGLQ
jgi:hypothetical protein